MINSGYISIFGLVVDIVGGFMVSVEAIKLHNLKYIVERFLKPVYYDSISERRVKINSKYIVKNKVVFLPLYSMLYFSVSIIIIVMLYNIPIVGIIVTLVNTTREFVDAGWIIGIPFALVAMVSVYTLVFCLRDIVIMSVEILCMKIIKLIEFIEDKTPNGTVGIIGFMLMMLGFLLQVLGTTFSMI